MRSVLAARLAILALAPVALAACADDPAHPGAAPDSYNNLRPAPGQTAVADPGCVVHSHMGILRPGDNIPTNYAVRNTGRWCFWGIGISGASAAGARMVDHPDHGEVRILPIGNGIAIGYRPQPGYAGGDSFLVSLPSGYGGYEFNVSATVRVTAAAP